MWSIYVITNIPGGLYIGATRSLKRRMREHRKVIGLAPEYKILETGDSNNWRPAEHSWITRYRADASVVLLNKTAGGNGCETASEETRRKLSAALRGMKRSDVTRQRMSAAQKGLKKEYSEEGKKVRLETLAIGRRRYRPNRGAHLLKLQEAQGAAAVSAAATKRNHEAWARRTAEECAAIGQKRSAAWHRDHSAESRSQIASHAARALYDNDPQARSRFGERIRNWWANLSPEERREQIERRQNARLANRLAAAQ